MKKYLSKFKNWIKNNYLAVILLCVIAGIFILKSGFTNNLTTDSKWRSVIVAYCKGNEGSELVGIMELAGCVGTTYDTNNLQYSYNNIISALKKNNKSLYNKIKDYTVEYNYAPVIFDFKIISMNWGNDTCKVLDKDGNDHYKELISGLKSSRKSNTNIEKEDKNES